MKLSEISIKRPVFATMMIGTLLVIGIFSYFELSVQLFPNVDFPFVVVQTIYKGGSAETVETEVTKKIEEAVNAISDIKHITSTSKEGYSLIIIEFKLNKDVNVAAQEVREKVAGIRAELPDEIDEPIVTQFNPTSKPVISLVISGKRPLKAITQIAKDKIKPRLEVISGVGSVDIIGGFEREILIALNPDKMESYGITIKDVRNTVAAGNMEIPGGRVEETSNELLLRTKGRLKRVEQFNHIIVKNKNGTPIYLNDIARVVDTIVEQRSLSRYNGHTAVALNIINQSGANVVNIANESKVVINKLKSELPPDVNIEIVQDNSNFIKDSIHEILFNIEFGTMLAVLVIFLFLLDIKPTIITGLSIPISIIATFSLMKLLGFTINFMTLMGLSLAVGLLIDDAIVVVENIYRHLDEGKTAMQAAFDGTAEIGLAVMATTFTVMVVFLPVAFMEGIVGRFFYQFGMTIAFAVLISLFVAFTLTPMLSSRMLKKETKTYEHLQNEYRKSTGFKKLWLGFKKGLSQWNLFFERLNPRYKKLLAMSLKHRWVVVSIALVSFVAAIYLATLLGTEFITQSDKNKLAVSIETPPGTTLQETSKRIAEVEKIVTKLPEVKNSFVTIGSGINSVTQGNALFLLKKASQRKLSAKQLIDSVRTLIRTVPGIKYAVSTGETEGGGEREIEISVRGDDREEIANLIHKVQKIAGTIPGAIDIDNTLEEGKPELQIKVDRDKADDLGLSLYTIPMTVRTLVEGQVVSKYKEGDNDYDVRIRLDKKYRSSARDIGKILIESKKKIPGRKVFLVPLNRVATIKKETSIGKYNRYDRQNEARVNANVLSNAFAGTVTDEIMKKVSQMSLPPGYTIQPIGSQEMMKESFGYIYKALALSVIFIYLLLASLYESFFDPFSIMFSLPLALVGAILGLLIFGSPISIMALIGIIMLMGLVTKNAILLIDFVKQQREKGVSRFDAILIAGPIRLRPILMTTFAMVFGMLPLAFALGPGAEMRAPMARAVIGGVISSTLLTLVVVPVVYTLIDDVVGFFSGNKKKPVIVSEDGQDEQFSETN
ncbi:MAG: efflux RND transporter permease subunit [FCB group bacterium]|nr:efflux RND transporter permease subunit [FCB group bacterium]